MAGPISRWWAAQHGRQYSILATLFGAFVVPLSPRPVSVIVFCKIRASGENTRDWPSLLLVVASTVLIFVTPEFLVFKGHVSTLDEIYEIRSTAELKRRRSEGDSVLLQHLVQAMKSDGMRFFKSVDCVVRTVAIDCNLKFDQTSSA